VNQPGPSSATKPLPIFLSIVLTVQDESATLEQRLWRLAEHVTPLVADYEIVVVDNGSFDDTTFCLRRLAREASFPNLQVFVLAGRVDRVTARWVGVENSLGDLIVCLDWHRDNPAALAVLVQKASEGFDLVFTRRDQPIAKNRHPKQVLYRTLGRAANRLLGLRLDLYSSSFLAVSRRIVNYTLQFPEPQIKFRNLASTTGFNRAYLEIASTLPASETIKLRQSVQRGIKLITSSSALPMRVATTMATSGAAVSLLYSMYVILIWLFKKDVAPGWVSLSMQQSVMFFLISMVLLVMSEYVLDISSKSNSGPPYYIADEFLSDNLVRKSRLNLEVQRRSHDKPSALGADERWDE